MKQTQDPAPAGKRPAFCPNECWVLPALLILLLAVVLLGGGRSGGSGVPVAFHEQPVAPELARPSRP